MFVEDLLCKREDSRTIKLQGSDLSNQYTEVTMYCALTCMSSKSLTYVV